MTSLKVKDANEIAEAMAKALGDVEFNKIFKSASIEKEAMGPAETELATFIAKCKAGQADNAAWAAMRNKYFGGGEGQTALAAELKQAYGEMNADSKINYYIDAMDACEPAAADDEQMVSECSEGCKCAKCMGDMVDDRTALAIDFAMGHLVKVADALDNKGFSTVAGMIDETIAKLAAKKSKKEEEKESKKSKKEEKESKKSKKEEKEEKESKKESKKSKKEEEDAKKK